MKFFVSARLIFSYSFLLVVFVGLQACSGGGGGGAATPAPAASWSGTKQLGVAARDTYGYSVATDTNGNVYVTGYTYSGLDGNTLTGTTDFFVTKYNSIGVKQYTKQLGVAAKLTSGFSVTTDASGNV